MGLPTPVRYQQNVLLRRLSVRIPARTHAAVTEVFVIYFNTSRQIGGTSIVTSFVLKCPLNAGTNPNRVYSHSIRGFSPPANDTDRAIAACRRS
jgi:hypothetical protein